MPRKFLVVVDDSPEFDAALRFACAAGAVAATRPGAQSSLPERAEVEGMLG